MGNAAGVCLPNEDRHLSAHRDHQGQPVHESVVGLKKLCAYKKLSSAPCEAMARRRASKWSVPI